jgi:hypothetical protein
MAMSAPSHGARAGDCDFVVAPDGRDEWSGRPAEATPDRSDGPFATLDRARLAVRQLKAQTPERRAPYIVLLRGGTYFLQDTVTFTPEDSGRAQAPVIYAAWPGETPLLSGGVKLGPWAVNEKGAWQCVLEDARADRWNFIQLFVDGQRRPRPRLPASGYYRIAARIPPPATAPRKADDRFQFQPGQVRADWRSLGDVEVVAYNPWFTSRLRVKAVDAAKNLVVFTGSTRTDRPYGQLKEGLRYQVENVAEALDAPGQWYLERATGQLTYLPLPGEDPARSQAIAPRLEKLLVLAGQPQGQSVEHLVFQGLGFAHTNWVTPPDGSSMVQAAVLAPAALHAAHARNCAVRDCLFTLTGGYGAEFGTGCRDNRVEGCRCLDLGAGGVKVGTVSQQADDEQAVTRHVVRDNLIAGGGRIHAGAVGVWLGHAAHCVVEHNEIHDLYYTGISVGWRWGYAASGAHHNLIQYNHIHHIGQGVLSDMGGIYTLGPSPGTVLRFNRIHDIERADYGGWGIYFDEGTSDVLAENNLVYRTHDGGFNQHYGEANIFVNNILGPSRGVQLGPSRLNKPKESPNLQDRRAFTFERNVVYGWGAPSPLRAKFPAQKLPDGSPFFVVDNNLYWNAGQPVNFAGQTLAEWRAAGYGANSLTADPLFVAPQSDDFSLRPGSPAFALGFKAFDIAAAGRLKRQPRD